ncbi:MAG: hypothetical protein ACLGIE_15915 [Alphaproteobacteria bacterium]
MSEDALAALRRFFRLADLLNGDDPEGLFFALVDLAKWSVAEKKRAGAHNDALLSRSTEFTSIYMGLILFLATLDRSFFNLARRMAARTLVRHEKLLPTYRHMAANLLAAGDGPKARKSALARDVALILAVAIIQDTDTKPTENSAHIRQRSGCGKAAAILGVGYSGVESVWKQKEKRLESAGFSPEEVSEFFAEFVR